MTSIEKCQEYLRIKIQNEIRSYMNERNIAPTKLAKLLGKPRSAIYAWLSNDNGHNFSFDTLVELQLKLGIQIFYLRD